jgi:hypothetical protein
MSPGFLNLCKRFEALVGSFFTLSDGLLAQLRVLRNVALNAMASVV